MKKKIIVTVVVLLVVAGAVTGGIFGYKAYQKKNLVAKVVPVSYLNMGYWGDEMSSYGMVTNDLSQDIYVDSSQIVSEIYVEEGQTVAVGDKLMSYDTTQSELELELKQLQLQSIINDIASTTRELNELKNTTPIPDTPEEPEEPEEPEPEPESEQPVAEKTGNAYNYISTKAKNYNKDADGSEEKPYRFLCTKESFVYGSYLNYLREKKYVAVFEIREKNKKSGTLISSWTVNGGAMDEVADDSKWSVLDRQEIVDEPIVDEPVDEPIVDEPEVEEPEGYTAAELAKEIKNKEKELKDLDLDKREAELDVKSAEEICKEGTVYATINGTVKKVCAKDEIPNDGSAFLSVSGSEGLYVTGDISEMMLSDIKVGQAITATSWDSGKTFQATITEISKYPESGSNYYGGGNPNASFYPFTAYIEDSSGLTNGEYVELSMTVDGSANSSNAIVMEKAFIRDENGRSYVYVANDQNLLEKRYISTGKTVYGSSVMINSGLSQDDRIAFPYGKTAKEGVRVEDSDSFYE